MKRIARDALALFWFVLGMTGLADLLLARLARSGVHDPSIRVWREIEAPIEAVWTFVGDVRRQSEWMTDLGDVRMLDPGPLAVGSRAEATVTVAGISTVDRVTISVLEPPRRFGIVHEGRIRGDGLISLASRGAGGPTIVEWEERLLPPVFPYVGAAFMRPVLRRVFQADLDRLAELAESGGGAGSPSRTR